MENKELWMALRAMLIAQAKQLQNTRAEILRMVAILDKEMGLLAPSVIEDATIATAVFDGSEKI